MFQGLYLSELDSLATTSGLVDITLEARSSYILHCKSGVRIGSPRASLLSSSAGIPETLFSQEQTGRKGPSLDLEMGLQTPPPFHPYRKQWNRHPARPFISGVSLRFWESGPAPITE